MDKWLVNTNELHHDETWTNKMIHQNRVFEDYKGKQATDYQINNIKKGDMIFLYQNGNGIIAFGYAISNPDFQPTGGGQHMEVAVNWLWSNSKRPIVFTTVNDTHVAGRTCYSLNETINLERVLEEVSEYFKGWNF